MEKRHHLDLLFLFVLEVAIAVIMFALGYWYARSFSDERLNTADRLNSEGSQSKIFETPEEPLEKDSWFVKLETKQFTVLAPRMFQSGMHDGRVKISHSVPYAHDDPCDFIGSGIPKKEIRDFDIEISLMDGSVQDVMKSKWGGEFVEANFRDGVLVEDSGYLLEQYEAHPWSGLRLTMGVEGCGSYSYYFPVGENRTLFIERPFVSEFMEVASTRGLILKALGVPDTIWPQTADVYFMEIVRSVRVKGE
ncbi:MAG: hypothetical protein HY453_01865 [Parcubacteria group bacterium]|nr:hypothetical protein [Parcubacteria group bacterium]